MGSINMQTAAKKNLLNFTVLPSLKNLADIKPAIGQGEFYQQIAPRLVKGIYGKQLFRELAEMLMRLAHHAYTVRRTDVIEMASQILLSLPLPQEYRSVGLYYHAICIQKQGRVAEACATLERVAEEAPLRYRARATQMLGLFSHAQGDYGGALSRYVEATRIAASRDWCDPYTIVTTQQNIAILKSIDGDHRRALTDLENLLPLVRTVGAFDPYKYYHYLNSFAVELGEAGRLDEARNICKIVLASPYAFAYPEWRETDNDIALRGYRSRSVRSHPYRTLNKNNVMRLPAPDPERSSTSVSSTPSQPAGPARVFSMQKWKEKMGKETNGDHKDSKSDKDMNQDEILYEIMNIFTEKDMDREIRLEMLESIRKLAAKKRANKQEKEPGEDSDQD
jgi:tetratricopeptide (TPR) repeat protein